MRNIYLLLYYGFARYLPSSYAPVVGKPSNAIRIFLVKRIFKSCGKISTIDRLAYFGNGKDLEIGDYSGIGERCVVPKNTIIGKYVMMASDVHIVKTTIIIMIHQSLCVFRVLPQKFLKQL